MEQFGKQGRETGAVEAREEKEDQVGKKETAGKRRQEERKKDGLRPAKMLPQCYRRQDSLQRLRGLGPT